MEGGTSSYGTFYAKLEKKYPEDKVGSGSKDSKIFKSIVKELSMQEDGGRLVGET